MLNSFAFSVLMGALLGTLAGLGVGGGSLLILWLTLVLKLDTATARSINLMFFISAAGTVSLLRRKQGTVHWKALLPAILAGCLSAGLMSLWGQSFAQPILQKIFGGFLLIVGLRELFYRPRKAR